MWLSLQFETFSPGLIVAVLLGKTVTVFCHKLVNQSWLFLYYLFYACQQSDSGACLEIYSNHFSVKLPGVLKKNIALYISQISQQPSIGLSNLCSPLKTEIHMQILNTNPFLCHIRDQDIYKTKCGSETDKFIFILSHSGLKIANFVPSSANWHKMDPDSSQVVISGPSNPN